MVHKPAKIYYLDDDQVAALVNETNMRLTELEIVQENPSIILFYKTILNQLRRS